MIDEITCPACNGAGKLGYDEKCSHEEAVSAQATAGDLTIDSVCQLSRPIQIALEGACGRDDGQVDANHNTVARLAKDGLVHSGYGRPTITGTGRMCVELTKAARRLGKLRPIMELIRVGERAGYARILRVKHDPDSAAAIVAQLCEELEEANTALREARHQLRAGRL